ncbi:hypothetical protein M758_8G050700 [Ceratodon purpureus]|nr:hypothetical protein M758_8G050700 [Ceratodon purpureus]
MPNLGPLGAMVMRGCCAVIGRVGGVRSFSTIRGGSGPVRYNPQGPEGAKPARRESREEAGVLHSRPLQRWKRGVKADEDWGLRKSLEERRYWDGLEDVGREGAEEEQSFASAEMQRLKAEMKVRDSSPAPILRRRERIHPVAEEVQVGRKHETQFSTSPTKLKRVRDEAAAAPADSERTLVAKEQSFGEGLFYGDGRKFEGLKSESSNWNRGPQALKRQGSGLFYGDGRKFEGALPNATGLFNDPFIAAEDKLFETVDTEEDKAVAKEKEAAKNYALRLLAMAPQTAQKLRQKLIGRNVRETVIESTITDLQRCGLQSDLEYAEAFARSRWRSSLWGPQRLKQELRQRGVCAEHTEAALEKIFSTTKASPEQGNAEDEEGRWGMTKEASEHLWEKAKLQWGRGGSISPEARKRRMVGWLQRRGFNWSITSHILKSLESQDREFG